MASDTAQRHATLANPLVRHGRRHGLAALWLVALCAYVLAGIPVVSFHGDEAMQIWMSSDYWTALREGRPQDLLSYPPFDIDSPQHLRLINGTVNRYTIGLAWDFAGYDRDDLPPHPGWDWGLQYAEGVATGHRPAGPLLNVARLPSTLFLCLSIVALFAIADRVGGRPAAYVASGLYAVNPIILLNARRAMQEGSLLAFGLLAILVAILIARRQDRAQPIALGWWLLLSLLSALTLASKHSGIVFVASAYLSPIAGAIFHRRAVPRTILALAMSGIVSLALFVALSPALWSDPLARAADLVFRRQELLNIQVAIDPVAPTTLGQRLLGVVSDPFIAPPVHFELASWNIPDFAAEVSRYDASPLSGLHAGPVLGGVLTLLAGLGVAITFPRALLYRGAIHAGMLLWLLITVASLLLNPLPWQRYALPLYPLAALFAALGLVWLAKRVVHRLRPPHSHNRLPAAA